MRNYFYILLLLFTITSCIGKNNLVERVPYNLFNSNSAKIWVLVKVNGAKNDVPLISGQRGALILYDNLTYTSQRLIYLGSTMGNSGYYKFTNKKEDKLMLILQEEKKEEKAFIVLKITPKRMVLKDEATNTILAYSTLISPLQPRR